MKCDSIKRFSLLQRKAKGQDLFDKVCEFINLAEKDYFGLNFVDRHGYTVWIENEKRLSKQVKSESIHDQCYTLYAMLYMVFNVLV